VSLGAEGGKITMVLGVSGSGKTTLLKLCKGLLAPQRGSLRVAGRPVLAGRRSRLEPRVAYIPQQLGLVRSMSVLDNVLVGALADVPVLPSLIRRIPESHLARARALLERLGIERKADEKVHALSGGERQRAAIARALMQRPTVVLADEFISQLDPLTSVAMMEVLREVASGGVAVIQTTHEMEIVERYADVVVVLRDGQKVLETDFAAAGHERIAAALR
jgi:phosphonate transport system ATP-binding protein